jgi:very-short-patch-repair endonuclease
MLRWHYRSRHGSLIAFSNKEFYKNQLIAFPSPIAKSYELGVKLVHVPDGVYENRRNVVEAKRVVATALRHMRERPSESLGVVTLNATQRELVEDLFEQQVKADPVAQRFIETRADGLEPFFIKNLENVQGDERDVIYISVTFGRSAAGQVYQRFGPINGPTGHRRLNVLFTRARKRVVVFASMLAEHINASPSSSWGVRALKGYLHFAQTGVLEQASFSGRPPDSDFEVEVSDALRARGFETVAQVGVAGYYIDLAVKHPTKADTFLLGIECDGRTYHSGVTARDRDRLRQSILEGLGWKIHRIWSTDWFKASEREIDRIAARVAEILEDERAAGVVASLASDPELTLPGEIQLGSSAGGGAEKKGWQGEVEAQPLSVQEVSAALHALREEIERDLAAADAGTDILRDEMLELLLRTKPRSRDDWLRKIPLDVRLSTDGPQLQAYLDRILDLTAQLAP